MGLRSATREPGERGFSVQVKSPERELQPEPAGEPKAPTARDCWTISRTPGLDTRQRPAEHVHGEVGILNSDAHGGLDS